MMNLETIMTIDIQVSSTFDVFTKNEVVNLSLSHTASRVKLDAASYLASGGMHKSLTVVLSGIYNRINQVFPNYNMWLFIGNSAVQLDTRIIRYRRLWGGFKSRGFDLSFLSDSFENMIEVDGGLKFFGAVPFSKNSLAVVFDLIMGERCSYIAALPNSFDVKCALSEGWSGDISKDFDLICCACEKEAIVLKKIGEFDDCNRGFLALALSENIGGLII
ncbi:hypothetical protein IFT69_10895 [Pseudomonas putida]|nr:hypothetical protein [Pseudomonas putida]